MIICVCYIFIKMFNNTLKSILNLNSFLLLRDKCVHWKMHVGLGLVTFFNGLATTGETQVDLIRVLSSIKSPSDSEPVRSVAGPPLSGTQQWLIHLSFLLWLDKMAAVQPVYFSFSFCLHDSSV